LQKLAMRLSSQVSSSGGGLPGRPGLERVSGRSLFLRNSLIWAARQQVGASLAKVLALLTFFRNAPSIPPAPARDPSSPFPTPACPTFPSGSASCPAQTV